jgi:hypothetical protein
MIPIHPNYNDPMYTKGDVNNNQNDYLFVANDVRNIMILFTLYFPNDHTWVSCLIVIINNLAY